MRKSPPACLRGSPWPLWAERLLQRCFETGEPKQWDLLQELEIGLKLYRQGDTWIRVVGSVLPPVTSV